MTATKLSDVEESQEGHIQSRSLSIRFNNSWKRSDLSTKVDVGQKISNATFQMQISENMLEVTPQVNCVSVRSSGKNPASVARRNARERRRIKNVNSAFDELRQHVPHGDSNRKKKISKVDTLQSAIEYIKALEELVRSRKSASESFEEDNESDKENCFKNESNSLDLAISNVRSFESQDEKQSSIIDKSETNEIEQSKMSDSIKRAFDEIPSNATAKRSVVSAIFEENCIKKISSTDKNTDEKLLRDSPENDKNFVKILQSDLIDSVVSSFPTDDETTFYPIQYNEKIDFTLTNPKKQANACETSNGTTPFQLAEDQSINCYFDLFPNCYSPTNTHSINFTAKDNENAVFTDNQSQLTALNVNPNQTKFSIKDNCQQSSVLDHEGSQWFCDFSEKISKDGSWSHDQSSDSPRNFYDDQSGSDLSEFSSAFVPITIDQINPSINFLPEEDDYIQATFQIAADHGFNQTSFQSSDHSWVLAQLN